MTMRCAVLYDCEYLTMEGAQKRYWAGPLDPDPIVVQVGAVRLGLEDDFPILETEKIYVTPVDRFGRACALDPYFIDLTGISQETVSKEGISLKSAIDRLAGFAGDACLWAWGKDELNLMAISCYVAGIDPVLPANRFGNASRLLLKAGMPYEDIQKTNSGQLADYFGIDHPPLNGHDALDDALSIAFTLQHLLHAKRLTPSDFDPSRID
jgi:DNA polymerase III epsilon subunit-like protein